MQQGFVKVAAISPKIKVADPAYNGVVVLQEWKKAREKNAEIIVFPELCLSGATCGDLFFQDSLIRACRETLEKIVNETKGFPGLLFLGLPIEKDGKLYNAVAAVSDGKILAMYPKKKVTTPDGLSLGRYFAEGNDEAESLWIAKEEVPFGANLLLECSQDKNLKVACKIGQDAVHCYGDAEEMVSLGATILVNPSANFEIVGKKESLKRSVLCFSEQFSLGMICAGASEGESSQDYVFASHNMIAENGKMLAMAEGFMANGICSDLDLDGILGKRKRNPLSVSPKGTYRTISFAGERKEMKMDRKFSVFPFIPEEKAQKDQRCETILTMQAYGLKKRLEHVGCGKVVLGVSGGLDSTLAMLVVVKAFDLLALPREGILAITMPCFGTTERTKNNAVTLAKALGVSLKEISIKEAVLQHFEDIGQSPDCKDVAYENAQARERTQVLMDVANMEGGLVIGTGDLSELALGFATYNGDHMSMYGVNAGIPKTLLRSLVDYYADTCNDEVLKATLKDILATPVSPELLPPKEGEIAQKTEDIVGPYELHDFFLYYMLRKGYGPKKLSFVAKEAFSGMFEKEEILKWMRIFYRRFFAQQFKRSCLPDGPKIGSVGLSPRGDFCMPSDAVANVWLKELEEC